MSSTTIKSLNHINERSNETNKQTLLLISHAPNHPIAQLALRFAKRFLETTNNADKLSVFFYGEGAHTANNLMWQTEDQVSITNEWQMLASRYNLSLPVCVSTALARGICDEENRKRHELDGDNLAGKFSLVGLSTFVMAMQESKTVQF